MGTINVLDFSVANLIAAGEVVDRPGSVVKELLENAIDAGATQITVEVKQGGVAFLRVSDNGCGMSREDAPVSLRRHATSKIRTAADLGAIFTLGFRGEALAAISSVSKIRIMTKRAEDETGTLLEADGGNVRSVVDAGCPNGTTVIVEALFHNVPARLKFLKKDATETMYITANVEKIAISHPQIAFRLICDGQTKLTTVGDGKLKNTIFSVYGKDFASKIIPISGGVDGIDLTGFIGTPQNCRANRNLQVFFINRRYIRSKTVSAALEQAFTSFIPVEKFPCAILFLDIHPSAVDVNVHPAKLECKFSNDRLIFDTVYYTVRNALENQLSRPEFVISDKEREKNRIRDNVINAFVPINDRSVQTPAAEKEEPKDGKIALERFSEEKAQNGFENNAQQISEIPQTDKRFPEQQPLKELPPIPTPDFPIEIPKTPWDEPYKESVFQKSGSADKPENGTDAVQTDPKHEEKNKDGLPTLDAILPNFSKFNARQTADPLPNPSGTAPLPDAERKTGKEEGDPAAANLEAVPPYRIVGELFRSYVIVEMQDTSYIIDKHAAHERILFEELRANTAGNHTVGQILLTPAEAELSAEEVQAADEYRSELEKTGFSYTVENRKALLSEIPSFLSVDAAIASFVELCGNLAAGSSDPGIDQRMRYEKALYQAACKAAIKAGRDYDDAHLKWICDRLLALPDIKYCPHGRPVCFEITKGGMEHRFLRS